jgi:hypothetical protein
MRLDGHKMQKKDVGASHNKKMRRFMRQLHKENDVRIKGNGVNFSTKIRTLVEQLQDAHRTDVLRQWYLSEE